MVVALISSLVAIAVMLWYIRRQNLIIQELQEEQDSWVQKAVDTEAALDVMTNKYIEAKEYASTVKKFTNHIVVAIRGCYGTNDWQKRQQTSKQLERLVVHWDFKTLTGKAMTPDEYEVASKKPANEIIWVTSWKMEGAEAVSKKQT